MNNKTILSCAVTGNITSPEQNPNQPVSPPEIAQAAIDANKAGAAIIHIHVRNLKTAEGSMDIELYREVVDRIGSSGANLIVNLTTGEGGRFIPNDDDPRVAAPGSTLCHPELRVAHVKDLKPEICTLDFNTMNSGTRTVINTPRNLEIMANIINGVGTRPEVEIFDSGDLNMAKDFIKQGLLKEPTMFQMVLGVPWGAAANYQTLAYLVSQLPKECIWGAFGIGRSSFPMLALSYLMGGHVRVGMEDSVYIKKGELVKSNAQLVEKGVKIIESLGGNVATPVEARSILGLPV